MKGPPDEIKSKFLREVWARFSRRSRAIRYRGGRFEIRPSVEANDEAVFVRYEALKDDVRLVLDGNGRADLFISRNTNPNRGKIDCRIEGMWLPNKGTEIVEAFEKTISIVNGEDLDGPKKTEFIQAEWSKHSLRRIEHRE